MDTQPCELTLELIRNHKENVSIYKVPGKVAKEDWWLVQNVDNGNFICNLKAIYNEKTKSFMYTHTDLKI